MATKKNVKRKPVPPGDRMRFLRRKVAEGTASESEVRELEKLVTREVHEGPLDAVFSDGQPADPAPEQPELNLGDPPPDDSPAGQSDVPAGVQSDPATAPPPIPAAPPPPPPPHRLKGFIGKMPKPDRAPRVDRNEPASDKKAGGENWRDPYVKAAKGAGREASVLFIASRWLGGLQAMSAAIKSAGASPLVDVESDELKAMIVLTVDDYLPANVQLKPVHMAAFATTSLLGQTYYHRKAIAAEAQKVKDRTTERARREAAKDEQRAAESTPNPAPTPASVPAQPKPDTDPVAMASVANDVSAPASGTTGIPVSPPVNSIPRREPYTGPTHADPDAII